MIVRWTRQIVGVKSEPAVEDCQGNNVAGMSINRGGFFPLYSEQRSVQFCFIYVQQTTFNFGSEADPAFFSPCGPLQPKLV